MKNSDLKQYIKEKIITTLSEDMNNPRMILSDFYVKVGGRNFAAAITDIEDDNLLDNIVKAFCFIESILSSIWSNSSLVGIASSILP